MKPYSADLRSRVVASVADGMSRHKAAAVFRVGVSSVVRWVLLKEHTGSVLARPMGGSRGTRIAGDDRVWLLEQIKARPDMTLEEMRRELAEQRGLAVGYGSVWRFCAREKQTFKKKPARRPARPA